MPYLNDTETHTATGRARNEGKLIGPKPPLQPKHVWAIRTRLQLSRRIRDLALFNLAIDSKLRGRDLVKEYTRERVPLQWAMTQNNLGNALWRLGERESGTARLEEAVAAYREALTIFEAAGASHYASIAKRDLARVRALLAERRGS